MPNTLRSATLLMGTIIAINGCTHWTASPNGEPIIVAARVNDRPQIDGKADGSVWMHAAPISLLTLGAWDKSLGSSTKVELKAVYTDSHIAFLISRDDATRDDRWHKPWVWNASKNAYEQGSEQEDAVALAFELSGPFTADMLSPVDAVWDLWTWKAARTDPIGYALDKIHRYATQKPEGKAKAMPRVAARRFGSNGPTTAACRHRDRVRHRPSSKATSSPSTRSKLRRAAPPTCARKVRGPAGVGPWSSCANSIPVMPMTRPSIRAVTMPWRLPCKIVAAIWTRPLRRYGCASTIRKDGNARC